MFHSFIHFCLCCILSLALSIYFSLTMTFPRAQGNIHHLVCADIAETSMEQCKERYNRTKSRSRGGMFSAEFIVADCTKVRSQLPGFIYIFISFIAFYLFTIMFHLSQEATQRQKEKINNNSKKSLPNTAP